MNKFDQTLAFVVCFALGIFLGHYQAAQWDRQKAERKSYGIASSKDLPEGKTCGDNPL